MELKALRYANQQTELHLIALAIVLVVAIKNKLSYLEFLLYPALTQYKTTSLGGTKTFE
ncbi:hypothetical protein PIROE2DRAFT_11381 [Piromyces sp. E2]|nr:hypothetical protein PIROE2DRAFT_11381 [Piromyces sp. E2]|eukprot:OUM62333.1 hypothetical protein PIROE2DRAFT_11381 [Piromyces sp. E2]